MKLRLMLTLLAFTLCIPAISLGIDVTTQTNRIVELSFKSTVTYSDPFKLGATEARQAFWAHVLNSGCAGHTYGANGIWQVNRSGKPYGNSPSGGNWGTTPWDEAMRLPGSAQIAAGKRLIVSLKDWSKLEPMPDAAAPVEPAGGAVLVATAGVGDSLRFVYLTVQISLEVRGLAPGAHYTVEWFDPIAGKLSSSTKSDADASGALRIEPPAGEPHDWVGVVSRL